MGNIDDYTKLVNLIGNIVKAASDPEDSEGVDKATGIAHRIGDALNVISNDDDQK
jgi:hypothetical protein